MTEGEITGAMARLRVSREEAVTVEYLGDGVYASFDGGGEQIWLRTLEGQAIALERRTLSALDKYRERLAL